MTEIYWLHADDPVSKRFEWVPVPGRRLNIRGNKKYDIFLHQVLHHDGVDWFLSEDWAVSEGTSGFNIESGNGGTRKELIIEWATDKVREHSEKFDNQIAAAIEAHGCSPKYLPGG